MKQFVVVAALVAAAPAHAGIELVKKVGYTNDGTVRLRDVGDPRYMAVTAMSRTGRDGAIDVLDLATGTVHHVETPMRALAHAVGTAKLEAEVVSYTPAKIGLHVADGILELAPHHWFVELDVQTGKVLRQAELGAFNDDVEVTFIATDGARDAAWFSVAQFGETFATHSRGPKSLVLRRLDLDTLAVTDPMTVALPARKVKSGYEDRLMFHYAPDYSWFTVAEYDERAFGTKPTAQVYFIDPEHKKTFAVPALDTTYGVAFSRDGAYAYLGSSQLGTIARVDIAKQKIDKTTTGPRLTHDLAISPDGSKLFVIGSSRTYGELALPKLGGSTARKHDPEVAPGAEQLFGGGHVSSDGKYYVLRQAMTIHKDKTVDEPRELVIAKFVD
jgi:hypothetical protein